ncbi:MAG: metallophosphoesterase [Sedimentibacter sp.]
MNYLKRVSRVYTKSEEIIFDDESKFIIMSDCHRGDGSWSDSFSRNQNIYFAALSYYLGKNYTYIELGDGDELWEYRNMDDIVHQHSDAFWLMKNFYKNNSLYMIFGNHDMVKKNNEFVEKYLFKYLSERHNEYFDLFKNIKIHEGLILKHKESGNEIFLLHGHQVDFLNSDLWKIARFLVRYFWRPLENLCIKDVTRTAKNYKKKNDVARRLTEWVIKENRMLIAGHNHRPMFPEPGEPPYFNDGSCVHPRCITGIEIINGSIALIKWSVKSNKLGELKVEKDILAGPKKIVNYFHK